MIVLSSTTDKIQVVLAGAVATNQAQCVASWRDITSTPSYIAGRSAVNTNNTTVVDLVASPAASTQRLIDFVNVINRDTTNISVTVRITDGTNNFNIIENEILVPGERLEYASETGWIVKKKTPVTGIADPLSIVTLGSDVINNNAVANTLQDVTGLSFPVVAGELYWFAFDILYTAQATTTGSRWSVSGPGSPTALVYRSEYSLAATTATANANLLSYDLPAASNASSSSTGSNRALIEGVIRPASSGNVIARFASEIANSAITTKAGSRVRWQRTL